MSMGMRPDEVRPLLVLWGHARQKIEQIQKELNDNIALYESAYNTLKSPLLSGMPRGSGTSDCVPDAVDEVQEVEQMLNEIKRKAAREILETMRIKSMIDTHVETFPQKWQKVLRMKYEDDRTWASIMIAMELSETTVKRYESDAINSIGKVMGRNGTK